jgi:hypothetical protein
LYLLETVLLQLNFPAFLHEGAWAAETRREAIEEPVSVNAIAATNVAAKRNLSEEVWVIGLLL